MSGNIKKAWGRFMQQNFNFFKRGADSIHRERKYEHISIAEDFERIEKERKYQRLSLIEYRKKLQKQLLTQKLDLLKEGKESLKQIGDKELLQQIEQASLTQKMGEFGSLDDYKDSLNKELEVQKIESPEAKQDTPSKTVYDLESELKRVTKEIETLRETKKSITDVEKKIEELEPDYILVTGLQKKLVMNMILYYEFQLRNLTGVTIHPEAKKSIETVHYHLEHNLPVRRELLYEVTPELFDTEINELEEYERERILAKRPRLINTDSSIVRAIEDVPEERELDEFDKIRDEEYKFREFVFAKACEFTEKYEDFMEEKLQVFPSMEDLLENVENKPQDQLIDIEKQMYDDLQEMRKINDDYAELIKLNKVRVFKLQRQIYIPPYVQSHPRLLKIWTEKWEELVANSFELEKSILVPDNSQESGESKLEKVLHEQRAVDIQELINQSQEEYKAKVGGTEPIQSLDRNKKDQGLVKRVNVLSGAMNQLAGTQQKAREKSLAHFQTSDTQERAEESRVLLDEMTKVLFLNNTNPEKYNITFWAEHFNIQPQKLRNIFNFVSYAVPSDEKETEIGRVFRFIYETTNQKSQKKNLSQE